MHPGQGRAFKRIFRELGEVLGNQGHRDYISHYHSDFSAQGMTKEKWKAYKASLNSRYASIEIGPEDVLFYRHPKYSMITFTQNYRSKLKGGGWGHRRVAPRSSTSPKKAESPRSLPRLTPPNVVNGSIARLSGFLRTAIRASGALWSILDRASRRNPNKRAKEPWYQNEWKRENKSQCIRHRRRRNRQQRGLSPGAARDDVTFG